MIEPQPIVADEKDAANVADRALPHLIPIYSQQKMNPQKRRDC